MNGIKNCNIALENEVVKNEIPVSITIALIPLTIIIYVARIAMHENDGPIFYEQLRIGKNGKVFKMYKYRSMVIGADENYINI